MSAGKPAPLKGVPAPGPASLPPALNHDERLTLERYRLAAAASNEGLYDWDLRTDRVYYADSWKALLGYAEDEIGTSPDEWLSRVDPDDLIWLQATLDAQASAGGKPFQIEYRMTHRNGHVLWMMCRGIVVLDDEGEPIRIVGAHRDVTDRKNAEEQLRLSEERYALAAQGANDGLWDWHVAPDELYCSSRWTAMLGIGGGARTSSMEDWYAQIDGEDRPRLRAAVETHIAGGSAHLEEEVRTRHAGGGELWVLIRGVAIRDESGEAIRMAGSMTDITARKRAEQQLLFDAFHDGLTRLPNRMLLLDRIGQALGRRRRPEEAQFAVMIVDIDHFKTVNDSLGPLVGDEVLCAVGQRLDDARRAGDTVARLSADEYGVLMDGVLDVKAAVDAAERLAAAVAKPLALPNGDEVVMSVTTGIALSGSGYASASDMLRDAGLAMYRAKTSGRGRVEMFDDTLRERALSRLRLESDLRHAVENQEFRLFYQPIVRLRDGAIAGFEALMRWFHPQRGLIPPSDFVHLAEETGLILKMGRWALAEGTRQLAEWQGRFSPDLFMSVNVSGRQLMEDDLVAAVTETLKAHSITPGTLKLEITESLLLDDPGRCLGIMEALKSKGVKLSLDDFGTGFSSLSYLHRYPIGTLKIDRSFVRAAGESDRRSAIARIITLLAQALDLEVIAEGIEKESEAEFLRGLHCQYGQGYHFAPPLPKEAVEDMMDGRRRGQEALAGVSALKGLPSKGQ
ncbi:putative bifunctional diguanylate cyclase/phosphodiesterase [Nitrospirillum sp. BR 11828]|uniref:putative bifunctional diguanylate cyclase/phosphodiesterase n=1 Tax=Nitrospirillum sp. BR 11828 TaxID=3104325 RepID=UPI002ACAA1AE|nr:EAL domain-containing protein [Nitrospirillum sp. BR 11828]MDZ5647998.1 EAL domain-containing protein [Nitrospirillum sp. BR 11828]